MSERALASTRALLVVLSAANVAAALLAVALAWLVVPGARAPTHAGTLLLNGVSLAGYLLASVLGASAWVRQRRNAASAWLTAGRDPSAEEQRLVVMMPAHATRLVAAQWLGALVIFCGLNVENSTRFALAGGATILFTGLGMCAVAYLATERILRPLAAHALAIGPVEKTGLLGVVPRQLLGWILGTGSAVLGLIVIGIVELADPNTKLEQLAIAIVAFCGIAMLGGLTVEYLAAQAIAVPLRRLRTALAAVQAGDLDTEVQVDDATDIGLLQVGFNRMVHGLRERERTREMFSRHVGEDVARHALDTGGAALGGEAREVCTLFVDLVGSTNLAASRPADEVVELLNRFFAVVVHTIEQHGGSVNKFQGDAALAVFGAPDALTDAPDRALTAARTLAERLAGELPELQAGVGVSSGTAAAGNVGAEHRLEYTVIGDPVNEAARLTELAKTTPGAVTASKHIVEAASPAEAARWQQHLTQTLRGRTKPTTIMKRVIGLTADPGE